MQFDNLLKLSKLLGRGFPTCWWKGRRYCFKVLEQGSQKFFAEGHIDDFLRFGGSNVKNSIYGE